MSQRRHKKKSQSGKTQRGRVQVIRILAPVLLLLGAIVLFLVLRLNVVYIEIQDNSSWDPEPFASILSEKGIFQRRLVLSGPGGGPNPDLRLLASHKDGQVDEFFAADPYILIYDHRLTSKLPSTFEELLTVDAEEYSPLHFAIAGDESQDLVAFLLYLGYELLPETQAATVRDYLLGNSSRQVEEGRLPDAAGILVERIDEIRSRGLIAKNWTNWDRAALKQVLLSGRARYAFAPRSFLKSLSPPERFYLRFQRLPSATGRLQYRVIGTALSLESAAGLNAGQGAAFGRLLRSPAIQKRIEEVSQWTSVNAEAPFIDVEHRDAQRVLRLARSIVVVFDRPIPIELSARLR